jgi:hypothetical protein
MELARGVRHRWESRRPERERMRQFFRSWLNRLVRPIASMEPPHRSSLGRTDNKQCLRGSEWICWRCDHSGEAGPALWTANRIVTIDGARECCERAKYSSKSPPAIERTGDIEEQHGSSNSGDGHDVCEAFVARQFFPNGHIGLTPELSHARPRDVNGQRNYHRSPTLAAAIC